MTAARRSARTAPAPPQLWRQIVEQFPAPIAVASEDGTVVAMNRAFRMVVHRDRADRRLDRRLAPAILCASASRALVICRCPIVPGYCFECRQVDGDGGLVALIGRANQA